MIVKFHNRGSGGGSGPVEYLLGRDGDRDQATLLRGDPVEVTQLIDTCLYSKKYTSVVLSFQESDLPGDAKNEIMDSFEQALFPGLDPDQYGALWVEHRDKGRLELNLVVPCVELQSGKRLQPYFDRADRPRVNAWKNLVNDKYDLHDPDDPANAQTLTLPSDLPKTSQQAAEAITNGLLALVGNGTVKTRDDVVQALTDGGFEIARQTKTSISIRNPDGGRNIRLKGALYTSDFTAGPDLRERVESAASEYAAAREQRIREAAETYRRGIEIKRADQRQRYPRPAPEPVPSGPEIVAVDGDQHRLGDQRESGSPGLHGPANSSESGNHRGAGDHDRDATVSGRERRPDEMRGPSMRSGEYGGQPVSGQSGAEIHDNRGALIDDKPRAAIAERIRRTIDSVRSAASGIAAGAVGIAQNVRDYLSRKRESETPGERIERAGRDLGEAIAVEKSMKAKKFQGNDFNGPSM